MKEQKQAGCECAELRQEAVDLGNDTLQLYLRAARLRRHDLAEHLLGALEDLAEQEPCCQEILERAYAEIVRSPRLDS